MLESISRHVAKIGGDMTIRTPRPEATDVRVLVTGAALVEGDRSVMQTALRGFRATEEPILVAGRTLEFHMLAGQNVGSLGMVEVRDIIPLVHAMTTGAVACEPLRVRRHMASLTGRGIESEERIPASSVRTAEHHVALLMFGVVALVALHRAVSALEGPTRARVIESVAPPAPPVHQVKIATGVFRVALRAFAAAFTGVQTPVLFQHPCDGLVALEALGIGTVIAAAMATAALAYTVQIRVSVAQRTG
jgi:hypothetical protein